MIDLLRLCKQVHSNSNRSKWSGKVAILLDFEAQYDLICLLISAEMLDYEEKLWGLGRGFFANRIVRIR